MNYNHVPFGMIPAQPKLVRQLNSLTLQSLAWDEASKALLRGDIPAFDEAMTRFRSISTRSGGTANNLPPSDSDV